MKRVAIVGFGFMGRTHYGAWKKQCGAKVVAICDKCLKQFSTKVVGNIKGAADNSALPKNIKIYDDFDTMLGAGGFEIVDITLPTPLHPQTTIAALERGYHVLCEKPMALDLKSCDKMIAAAKKAKRELLIAQCVRFFPEYVYLRELVEKGTYGNVIAGDFTRFIAAPKWSPKGGSWMLDEAKSGGVFLDVHVHDADYITSIFGRPVKVDAAAHKSPYGFIDHTSAVYTFQNGELVTTSSSFAASASFVWEASARVFFEKATVYIGPMYKAPITVYPEEGKPFQPKVSKLSGYEAEIAYFLNLVEHKAVKGGFSAQDARESLALVLAEKKAALSGKSVKLK